MPNAIIDGIQALIDRYHASRREAPDRGQVVQMETDGECDKCHRTMFTGAFGIWFPRHKKLACAKCAGIPAVLEKTA